MTREDIIRLAKEAGFGTLADLWSHALARFAALVVKHERERIEELEKITGDIRARGESK